MMKKLLILLVTIAPSIQLFAQGTRWKRTRYELIGGIGASNFFGDLGGGNSTSKTARYLGDFDFQATRPTIMAGMRYKLTSAINIKFCLTYGYLKGADRYSESEARKSRDLEFHSPIFEQAFTGEYSIIRESNSRRWSERRKKKVRSYSMNLYVFGGVGGFYFDPQAKYNGKNYHLRQLGTEGQTVAGSGKKKYLPYSLCVPAGIGVKVGLNRLWDIGVEYGYRWTSTDYIDDAGGSYYDNAAIIEANGGADTEKGRAAGWLADNHKAFGDGDKFNDNMESTKTVDGKTVTEVNPTYQKAYKPGDRKPIASGITYRSGKASNDYYMFLVFTLSYKLRTGRNGLPKFKF